MIKGDPMSTIATLSTKLSDQTTTDLAKVADILAQRIHELTEEDASPSEVEALTTLQKAIKPLLAATA